MAGFLWKYDLNGSRPLILEFTMATTETLTLGDMLNLESNEVDLGVTNDAAFLGPFQGPTDPDDGVSGAPGTVSGTASTTSVRAIVNPYAILGDDADANARSVGDNLDISGATGAQGVTTDSNSDFFIIKDSAAAEDTLVKVTEGEHMHIQL